MKGQTFATTRDRHTRASGMQRPGRRAKGVGVDQDVVAAALAGRHVALSAVNLAAAIAALEARSGWSAEQIARKLGCSYRTVQRHRAARRAAEVA